jgi:glycosyltransferase involved in cell wall biosynthesis
MITVCILTKNAQNSLENTLESVKLFPEVLILDNGSTDKTLEIAKKYSNVKVHTADFCGFGALRNKAANLASHDWILALDSDEILLDSQEILMTVLDSDFAYTFHRHNFYRGKRIRGCGWSPDIVARLYNRKKSRYSDAQVHESLEANRLIALKSPMLHTPYRTTEEFLAKMQHYSSLFASQNQGKKKSSFLKAFAHGFYAFFRSYILKRGFLDGPEGFIISLYNSNTAFYKYLKLKEANILLEELAEQSVRSKQEEFQHL